MKKPAAVFISLVLIMFFASAALPADKQTTAKHRQITGIVKSVDTKTNTVTVEKNGREVVLSLEGKTRIIQCTEKNSIADLKVGDKVTANFLETTGKNSAKQIAVKEPPEK